VCRLHTVNDQPAAAEDGGADANAVVKGRDRAIVGREMSRRGVLPAAYRPCRRPGKRTLQRVAHQALRTKNKCDLAKWHAVRLLASADDQEAT
jgi:hypothetical protein